METATVARQLRPAWPLEQVDVPGYRLAVRRAPCTGPPGAGEPAVYVHGLGGASTNWTDLMGLLQDRFDGVAPDLPGFGHSPPPDDGDLTPAGHARAVVRLLERLAPGPVHLLGNSLGGAVAVRIAADRPDLVRTLTLISPALPSLRPRRFTAGFPVLATPVLGARLARALAQMDPERRARQVAALCFADPSAIPPERVAEAVAEIRRRAALPYAPDAMIASIRGLLADYVAPGRRSPWRLAAQVRVPTLLVYGGRDRLVAVRDARRAARTFPHARLVVLPRSGHVAQMEHPDVVAGAVRGLLAATAGRRGGGA